MLDKFPQDITQPINIPFSIEKFGLYALKIRARCQSGDLLGFHGGQDLRVEIDDMKLREIPPKDRPQYNNIPPTWNGTQLKGLAKTVFFILPLSKGHHILRFIPTEGARIEFFEIQPIEDTKRAVFKLDDRAEDGDKRPWYTFVLLNVPLLSLTADISVSWHFFDGDDVKLIVDNRIEENTHSKLWRYWLWSAKPWQVLSGANRESKTLSTSLTEGIHYIEFWADKTPTFYHIALDLGDYIPKHIPTVEDPKWTGDFGDDSDQIILARLIFGEARNQTKEAMVGIGWVVRNRLLAKRAYFGFGYHQIILKHSSTNYQFSPMNPNEKYNYPLVIDPLKNAKKTTQQAWFMAYDVAVSVIGETTSDPTGGATYFHSSDLPQEQFLAKSVPGAIFTKQIDDFLFYRDPNDL